MASVVSGQPYGYAGGDPVASTDPAGLLSIAADGLVGSQQYIEHAAASAPPPALPRTPAQTHTAPSARKVVRKVTTTRHEATQKATTGQKAKPAQPVSPAKPASGCGVGCVVGAVVGGTIAADAGRTASAAGTGTAAAAVTAGEDLLPGLPESAPKPLGLGSTGRTVPNNLVEQLAMEVVRSAPNGQQLVRIVMSDSSWLATEGWVKMQQIVNGINIHYVYNPIMEAFDDFKFKF